MILMIADTMNHNHIFKYTFGDKLKEKAKVICLLHQQDLTNNFGAIAQSKKRIPFMSVIPKQNNFIKLSLLVVSG